MKKHPPVTSNMAMKTEKMTKNIELERSNTKLRLAEKIFESANDGIVVTDVEGVIQMANPSFLKTTGYKLDEIRDVTMRILKSGQHDKLFYEMMWETIKTTGQWTGEIWNKRKNGEIYPEWLSISAIYDDEGRVILYSSVCRDLSERLKLEEKIRHQAFHDALTGLPNRFLFQDRLEKSLALAKRTQKLLATLFLDLDGFKKINDTLGHDIGDLLLQAVAQRLLVSVRASDTVARMGGDEFTIVLTEMRNPGDAEVVAKNVLEALAEPFVLNEHTIKVTASIGISLYPVNGQDVQTLMKQADIAMYIAKGSGKNKYNFYCKLE